MADKRKPIEHGWEGFAAAVLPANASDVQRIEMRKAFFAGAAYLFTLQMQGVSDGDDVTSGDEQFMRRIDEELRAFGKELDLEVLTRNRGAKA